MNIDRERLVALRKEKKVNQDELADKIGMKRSTYSYKEREGEFSSIEIAKISEVLGVEDIDLMGMTLNDPAEVYHVKSKNKDQHLTMETLVQLANSNKTLSEANKELAESNKILATNAKNLIDRIPEAAASLSLSERFSEILELIADIGTGRRWNSKDEAIAELNKLVIAQRE